MPVGAATRHEREVIDEGIEARDILAGMAGMTDLDTVESKRDEPLDAAACAGRPRVSEHGETSRLVDHRDGVADRQAILRHERRATVTEISVERIAEVRRPAVIDERPRNVRPPDRAASRFPKHVLEGDANTQLIQSSDNAFGPR